MSQQVSLLVSTMMMGMTLEINIRGIASGIRRISGEGKTIGIVILVCNLLCLLQAVGYVWSQFTVPNVFLLYKTWLVFGKPNRILAVATILTINRICWGAYDLGVSEGIWDDMNGCVWYSNSKSAYGYYSADISCDIFATFSILYMWFQLFKSDIQQM
ncbi:hypothetical protein HK100_000251, partial [Physocladia obscura]